MKCLYAYTEPHASYPAYINISQNEESGAVTVTVRNRGNAGRDTTTIVLSPCMLHEMCVEALGKLGACNVPPPGWLCKLLEAF